MANRRTNGTRPGPRGGVTARSGAAQRWRWEEDSALLSAPVRCRREQWYLTRAAADGADRPPFADVDVYFLKDGERVAQRGVRLHALPGGGDDGDLLGWVQSPRDATHVQVHLPDARLASLLSDVTFHAVAERDPKCHPLANVPRWDSFRGGAPVERVVLPAALAGFRGMLQGKPVEIIAEPPSFAALAAHVRGAACVIDPQWARSLRLNIGRLEALAATGIVLVDLETLVRALPTALREKLHLRRLSAANELMSARVEYSDVATRGFALQDVFPYATIDAGGRFTTRALDADRSWQRYADEAAFATLLSSETPFEAHSGDVLSAARCVGRGELYATDLPWIAAGLHGRPAAPRLVEHALRMHLGYPIDPFAQYWNRQFESDIVVRDISDLARRYAPLRTVRWTSPDARVARLGISLPAGPGEMRRNGRDAPPAHLLIRTGRVDDHGVHEGLPPEPLMIFMRQLAREVREQTAWARRHLAGVSVTWQFDAGAGLRYAVMYDSAAELPAAGRTSLLELCIAAPTGEPDHASLAARADAMHLADTGLFGDGSLAFQSDLAKRLIGAIERLG